MYVWLFVQKYGKDKLEMNETGYLKGESGIGVKRLWEWEWDNKMREEDTSLRIAFVTVLTFRLYLKWKNEWINEINWIAGGIQKGIETNESNCSTNKWYKSTEISEGRK